MSKRGRAEIVPYRLLLRHADAGVRDQSGSADDWRALSPAGMAQAEELVERFDGLPILRVHSSPALRCRQTVVPLARSLGIDVEPCRELALAATPSQLIRFLEDPDTEAAVLCTHRETLEGLFVRFALSGVMVPTHGPVMEKAAAWMLTGTLGDRNGVRLQYLPALERVGVGHE